MLDKCYKCNHAKRVGETCSQCRIRPKCTLCNARIWGKTASRKKRAWREFKLPVCAHCIETKTGVNEKMKAMFSERPEELEKRQLEWEQYLQIYVDKK